MQHPLAGPPRRPDQVRVADEDLVGCSGPATLPESCGAARAADGRRRLDVMLKEIERIEWSVPAAERFDVAILRDALGLPA